MKTAILFRKPFGFAMILAAGLLVVGCGRKEASNASVQATPPLSGRALYSSLQAEMDSLRNLPHEDDPAKRPLVISERAGNRRDWSLRALEHGYTEGGHTSSQWDPQVHAAFVAYVDYSRAGATPRRYSVLTNAVLAAVGSRCADPMIQYMQVRYGLAEMATNQYLFGLASMRAFRSLLGSPYHPWFKFMAGYRAVEAARSVGLEGERSGVPAFVTIALEDLARDTNAPPEEVFEPAFLWVEHAAANRWIGYVLTNLEPIIERNWGQEEACFRWRGLAEISQAWNERGGGYADTVTEQGWEGFRKHLQLAEPLLETAWKMSPTNAYTAYLMMKLELGQGLGRERMGQWFERAMALDTNYYDAAKLMSFYLEPRWHGSDEQALEFARKCVTSTNWGGRVPLVLPELHRSLARYHKLTDSPDYWQRAEVWDDVRSAYERFFQLNPEGFGYRHDYARDAFLCGHYSEFLAQTKLFPWTNFNFFGGEGRFGEMLARAGSASSTPTAKGGR